MLEDNHADILGKACVGLGISPGRFPNAFFLPPVEPALREAAEALGLGSRALADIAYGRYAPEAGPEPDGLAMFSTPFSDIVVNSFLVWDAASGVAAAFDTGGAHDAKVPKVGRDVPGPPQEVGPDSPEVCPYLLPETVTFPSCTRLLLAPILGLVSNALRILLIVLLAPAAGEHYLIMHEAVGITLFFATLAFLWWLVAGLPQRKPYITLS
jgi:exosortase/archaeosortase family protein